MIIYPAGPAGEEARMRDALEDLRRQKRMRDMQREIDDLRRDLGKPRPGTTFIPGAPSVTTVCPAHSVYYTTWRGAH